MGGVVLNLIGPNVLSDLTDVIQLSFTTAQGVVDIDMAQVTRLCITLVCLYGAGMIFSYVQGFIMATVTQKNSKTCVPPFPKRSISCPLLILIPILWGIPSPASPTTWT